MQEQKKENFDSEEKKPVIIRNCTDLQRLKLDKLMQNPDKLVIIPERAKERGMPVVPDFVRNVMGSSAGAGSGEFHVYRHLRRKEYARQKYMKEKAEKEKLEEEYHTKLEENKRLSEEKTAKKRKKRFKKKQKQKIKFKNPKITNKSSEDSESDNEDDAVDTVQSDVVESKCIENNQANISKISDSSASSEIENNKSSGI